MVEVFDQVLAVSEEGSLCDSVSGGSDEKTIPFLKRLRDMLQENEGVISFVPGHRKNGQVVLGRLVVHDRIEVEATVLPRYFNHSSFASLRRQLNYFSFVRLGKGRQRESTYINDRVVELDDILALRRRPAAAGCPPTSSQPGAVVRQEKVKSTKGQVALSHSENFVESIVPVVHLPSTTRAATRLPKSTEAKRGKNSVKQQSKKKQQQQLIDLPSSSHNFISEDEESQAKATKKPLALDLTTPTPTTDPEVLEGCTALLGLSGKLW